MSGANVVFHPRAAAEYRRAKRWYGRQSQRAACRFEETMDRVVARIAMQPNLGALFRGRYRWMHTEESQS
jgi:plasmid stabilization system protein ParE